MHTAGWHGCFQVQLPELRHDSPAATTAKANTKAIVSGMGRVILGWAAFGFPENKHLLRL
jgi:hypothetical protein